MVLVDTKTYKNKTWKYLVPCLYSYGKEFIDLFNRVHTIATGIHDTHLKGNPITQRKVVYALFNSNHNTDIIERLIAMATRIGALAYKYEWDFPLDKSGRIMLVFKIPEIHHNAYENFLIGKYSDMYTEEFIDSTWKNQESIGVLKKDKKVMPILLEEIESILNCSQNSEQELEGSELALPLIKKQEIFNCEEGQTVFFTENLYKLWYESKISDKNPRG